MSIYFERFLCYNYIIMNSAYSPEVYNPDIHTFSVAIQYPDGSIGSRPFEDKPPDEQLSLESKFFDDLPEGSKLILPESPLFTDSRYIPIIPRVVSIHESNPELVGVDFNQPVPGRVADIIRALALAQGAAVPTDELVELVGKSKGTSPRRRAYSTVRTANEVLLDLALGHSVDVGLDHRYIRSNSNGGYTLLAS